MLRLFKIFKIIIFLIFLIAIGFVVFYFTKPLDYKYKFEDNIQTVAFYTKDKKDDEIKKDVLNLIAFKKYSRKSDLEKVVEFEKKIKSIPAKKHLPIIYNKNSDIVGYIKVVFNDSKYHILNSNSISKFNIIEGNEERKDDIVIFDLEKFKEFFSK